MHPLQLITVNLHEAQEILPETIQDHGIPWTIESIIDLKMGIIQASCTISVIKSHLEKLHMHRKTCTLINYLKEQKVDYTLLLYLQLPDTIRKTSEIISYLESKCTQMDIDFNLRLFYKCIWEHFELGGIKVITPDKYIAMNKKNDALEEYEKVKKSWGIHNPLFLQTYIYDKKEERFTNHVYHITRTVQDGILRLLDILKAGEFPMGGKIYKACGAFEHIIAPSTLTCQIYDCEILSSAFESKTVEEIKEMVLAFPQCISGKMIMNDLINIEDIVTFVVKDRTRKVAKNVTKISNHFIGNICAPKFIHRRVMDVCLSVCKARIDEAAKCISDTGILPESFLTGTVNDAMLTLDYSAIKSNGFTTAFSRKTEKDPFSRLLYADKICAGESMERHECLKEPHDLHGSNLTDKQRLMLIYTQLYTAPKDEMICYTEEAMETLAEEPIKVFFIFYCLPPLGFEPNNPRIAQYPVRG
jgi:hypothetical protein